MRDIRSAVVDEFPELANTEFLLKAYDERFNEFIGIVDTTTDSTKLKIIQIKCE